MLEKYVHMDSVVEKVTLVKSFQTGSEYATLPFASTSMGSVFRSRRLSMPSGSIGSLAVQYPSMSLGQISPKREGPSSSPSSVASTPTSLSGAKITPPPTYATRAAIILSKSPADVSRLVPSAVFLAENTILVNADEHRIDATLPPKSSVAVDRVHSKTTLGGKR